MDTNALLYRLARSLLLLVWAASSVSAQMTAPTVVHESADGRRTMLLDPRSYPLYQDLGHSPRLQPQITIQRRGALGFDVTYRFENQTGQAVQLGSLGIGILTLGNEFRWLNHNGVCQLNEATRDAFTVQGRLYPGSFYSPVAVLMNDRFAVGVSLLYDVLADQHDAYVVMGKPNGRYAGGPGGPGYSVDFMLSNRPNAANPRVRHAAVLQPGQQRTYTVAVRFVELTQPFGPNDPQPWLETIKPYRDHFASLYGGVTYERDTRPVRGWSAGNTATDSNPLGLAGSPLNRPDLAGWGPAVDLMLRPQGFERTMIWTPGGVHRHSTDTNFPSRFLSQLMTSSKLSTAFDTRIGLPRIEQAGHTLGLWWGRSGQMTPRWDTSEIRPLSYDNPQDMAQARYEMQLAARTGATMIGLDAFGHMAIWEQYRWVKELRAQYPQVKFVIEPVAPDVMHTAAASFFLGWQAPEGVSPERFYKIRNPHYLADFLVPGHESWAQFRYDVIRRLPGGATTPERIQQDAEFLARHGFTPVMPVSIVLTDPVRASAVPSWKLTVPAHLMSGAHRLEQPPVHQLRTLPQDSTAKNDQARAGKAAVAKKRLVRSPGGRFVTVYEQPKPE